MLNRDDIADATKAFMEATNNAVLDYSEGDVAGEEDFTGQLIGRIKGKFENLQTPNARWRVRAAITEAHDGPILPSVRFSARQTNKITEEPATGADMIFVLDVRASDYVATKGILIQAKRLERGKNLAASIATQLRSQCGDMLDLTAASYVFLYATTDVAVLSATIVEGSKRDDLHALEQFGMSAAVFFSDLAKCWIGDPRLQATDKQSLAVLRQRAAARNALLMEAQTTS